MLDTLLDVLVYSAGFLLIIGIFVFSMWRATRRDREWPITAEKLGMTYRRHDDSPMESFVKLKVFDTVGPKSLRNVVSGTRGGARVWLADYSYSQKLTGSVQPFGFTVCLLQHDGLNVPHLLLQSRGRPRSMTRSPLLERPDDDPEVAVDDDAEFARVFRLHAREGDSVLALLTPGLRERLRAIEGPHLLVEALGDKLVVSRRSWVAPAQAAILVDETVGLAEQLGNAAAAARSSSRTR
jgi:hypothetical protein